MHTSPCKARKSDNAEFLFVGWLVAGFKALGGSKTMQNTMRTHWDTSWVESALPNIVINQTVHYLVWEFTATGFDPRNPPCCPLRPLRTVVVSSVSICPIKLKNSELLCFERSPPNGAPLVGHTSCRFRLGWPSKRPGVQLLGIWAAVLIWSGSLSA